MSVRGLCLLVVWLVLAGSAAAQSNATTIGFESDCAGQPFEFPTLGNAIQVGADKFKSCGVSITSGGLVGQQQLVRPVLPPVGLSGQTALAGAYTIGTTVTYGDLLMVFAPAVKEVAFDVLGVDNPSGLQIVVGGSNSEILSDQKPNVSAGQPVKFSFQSESAILSVTIKYVPSQLSLFDEWYVDQLAFTARSGCGDNSIDGAAGEQCDDGNRVHCDGCDNNCRTTPRPERGCFDGSTCVYPEQTGGCTFCTLEASPPLDRDVLVSNRPSTATCDDGLFCTEGDHCNAGRCEGSAKSCDDAIGCTTDRCDEAKDQCVASTADGWCLIAGKCFRDREGNADNRCELCNAMQSQVAWSPRAASEQCGDPSCKGAIETPAARCDGKGSCVTSSPRACPAGACAPNATSCDGGCDEQQLCAEASFCEPERRQCVADLAPGAACAFDAQCKQEGESGGFCVDGVCCESSCSGLCEACDLPGTEGECRAVPEKTPDRGCAEGLVCGDDQRCISLTPASALGKACSSDRACGGSGYCIDGVCCATRCNGLCETCNRPDAPGRCEPEPAFQNPAAECGERAVCSGERSCLSYEARGNGLCTAAWGRATSTLATALWALVALGLTLARRRTRARHLPRKQA